MSKLDHIIFRKKVMDTVMGIGEVDEHNISKFNQRRFIKWREENDNAPIARRPEFMELKKLQDIIEQMAIDAIIAYKNHDEDTVKTSIETLHIKGDELIDKLDILSIEIEKLAA
ncbi:MAG: hypothetical protein HRU28_13940 [Rhizobiales bacterium]|nr:hypothetical protein [Hyphomicrobiales bacterium]